jgi:hypothetical protein
MLFTIVNTSLMKTLYNGTKPYIKQLEDSQTKSLKNIMEGLGWHEKV